MVPLDTPGLYRLWVSINGNIQSVKVSQAITDISYFNSTMYTYIKSFRILRNILQTFNILVPRVQCIMYALSMTH